MELLEDRTLLSTLLETISVPVDGSSVSSATVVETGVTYQIRASGTFAVGGPGDGLADAEYADFSNPPVSVIGSCIGFGTDIGIGINDTVNDGSKFPDWGPYDNSHVYTIDFVGLGAPISLNYHDCFYGDNSGSLTVEILSTNSPPTASAGGPYTIDEGESLMLDASASTDTDGDPLTYSWDVDGDSVFGDATGVAPTLTGAQLDALGINEGLAMFNVSVQVDDGQGSMDTDTTTLTVNNVAPTVGVITAPLDPNPVGTVINASGAFTDPGVLDTHTAVWDWGDTNTSPGTVVEAGGNGSVSGSHTYNAAGVYTVELTVIDDDGDSGQSVFQFVVIFDASAGFVSGHGRIDSPPGAYGPDPTLTGMARFGFVSKTQQGQTIPTGQTQFRFNVANLRFQSTSYDWLVVSGPTARFKGSGTINGAGDYRLLVAATDGQASGGGGTDKLRIKLVDKATDTVVYDNQLGAAADADPSTALTAGSIMLHTDGKPLHAVTTVGGRQAGVAPLTAAMLQPLVAQQIAGWAAAGANVALLQSVDVQVADLSGSLLGVASEIGKVWIDRDAAGFGWRVGTDASLGRMDLQSVVAHELGHLLGMEHSDGGVMSPSLTPSISGELLEFGAGAAIPTDVGPLGSNLGKDDLADAHWQEGTLDWTEDELLAAGWAAVARVTLPPGQAKMADTILAEPDDISARELERLDDDLLEELATDR